MAMRWGKTINGQAFHICQTTRGYSPLTTHFIDGKRVSKDEYNRRLAEARAVEQVKRETGSTA